VNQVGGVRIKKSMKSHLRIHPMEQLLRVWADHTILGEGMPSLEATSENDKDHGKMPVRIAVVFKLP
jgi:hypothetical protein